MKYPIYLRIGKTEGRNGYKVHASTKPNYEPVSTSDYRGQIFYPTVSFRIDIEVPDEAFKTAEQLVADLNVSIKAAKINGEIVLPEGITIKGESLVAGRKNK